MVLDYMLEVAEEVVVVNKSIFPDRFQVEVLTTLGPTNAPPFPLISPETIAP